MAYNRETRYQQATADYCASPDQPIRAVATANDVHHTTLSSRLKGQVSCRLTQEPQGLLSDTQVGPSVAWIIDLDAQGHVPTFNTVRQLVPVIRKASGGPERVGKNWVPRLIQRHSGIRSKIGKKILSLLKSWGPGFKNFRPLRGDIISSGSIHIIWTRKECP